MTSRRVLKREREVNQHEVNRHTEGVVLKSISIPEKHLQDAMATALSLDYWTAPEKSLCAYDVPSLSVNFLCMDQVADEQERGTEPDKKRAARFQDIFLDLTGWHASRGSSSRFFLDDRFHSNLDDADRRLKRRILALLEAPSRESPAYNALVSRLQEDFGLGNLDHALQRRGERNFAVRNMRSTSSTSFVSQNMEWAPDTSATKILKKVVERIEHNATIKRAAAMTDISENSNTLKDFLDRHHILDPLRTEYGDPQMENVVKEARGDIGAKFLRLFEIPSHVFVCNSSVCELACDAFLCPVAPIAGKELFGGIWDQWRDKTMKTNMDLWRTLTGGRTCGYFDFHKDQRVAVPTRWPSNCSQPLILPTEVFKQRDADLMIKGHMQSARDFLRVAYALVKNTVPQNGRERHLLALPVIGTGDGGARDMTGEIVENLFHVLDEFVSRHKVDCVIVAADEATYAHAQAMRKEPSSILHPEKLKAARDLAQLAASGHLSLFLGAGTSISSGLPSWKGLLNAIEDQLTSSGETGVYAIEEESNGDLLVVADKLEDLASSHANGKCLKTRVANLIEEQKCHPSLVLALLLSLPYKSIVTTNYDNLIETAYRNQNVASLDRFAHQPRHGRDSYDVNIKSSDLSILPHQPKPGAKKWLLKMHGCVSHPKKIVLSGKDYVESKVLTGIVQANLLTTHLLFCGFSLTDPNYQDVVRDVRKAMHGDR